MGTPAAPCWREAGERERLWGDQPVPSDPRRPARPDRAARRRCMASPSVPEPTETVLGSRGRGVPPGMTRVRGRAGLLFPARPRDLSDHHPPGPGGAPQCRPLGLQPRPGLDRRRRGPERAGGPGPGKADRQGRPCTARARRGYGERRAAADHRRDGRDRPPPCRKVRGHARLPAGRRGRCERRAGLDRLGLPDPGRLGSLAEAVARRVRCRDQLDRTGPKATTCRCWPPPSRSSARSPSP